MGVRADAEREFREFVTARSADLLRLARVLTVDRHAAEDLVQISLLSAWRSWSRVRAADDPDAYVRRVMVNAAAGGLRRRWRGEVPTERLPERAVGDQVGAIGDRDALVREVRALPPRQRAAIALRYFADLDDQDVADALGCSVSTARSQISRALDKLRVRTEEDSLSMREQS
jgi:RNA polymerase sigma-70 factor (sigma-E family)